MGCEAAITGLADGVQVPRKSNPPCPHCGVPGIVRTSENETVLVQKKYMECRLPQCGHTWVAQMSYLHGLSPSGIPNPAIDLPMRPARAARC
jgi:predicted RNA-binding Zn-ribbon protein involved in translation (DUF1610 family)